MNVNFKTRRFSDDLLPLPLSYDVVRYSHSVFGGPKAAEIACDGDINDLWELVERLRCPVEIYSNYGDLVWWGYVHEVQLRVGSLRIGVSLENFHNKVAVAYSFVTPGTTNVGARRTTPWAQDSDSVTEYGIRELLYTTNGSTDDHAVAARDAILYQQRYPTPSITFESGQASSHEASLFCRGWFDTLKWRYYTAVAATVDTAIQAENICKTGQFFTAVNREITSGIETSQFRDGDGTGLDELSELLKMGTTANRRMLAATDPNRVLTIYEESPYNPGGNTTWLINSSGELYDPFGTPVRREACPVGVWARLQDVIPATVDTSKLSDPSIIFIDEFEYQPRDKILSFIPRNVEPWKIGRPPDG
jgi:hypothetical protein